MLAVLAVLSLVLAALVTTAAAQQGGNRADQQGKNADQHCPDHDTAAKDDSPSPGQVDALDVDGTTVWLHYGDDGTSVAFFADEAGTQPLTVEYCIKAATDNSGRQTGDEGHVTWTNNGGQTPQISYVVVYGIGGEQPECPGGDGAIDLQPESGTNTVGDPHDLTATVTDVNGNPCEGAQVRFEVDSSGNPDPSSGSDATDSNGEADFSYTNDTAGTDTITACTNADGSLPESCDGADLSDTATKTWESGGGGGAQHLTCRANLLAGALAGNALPNLFEANAQSDPCVSEQNGLLVALDPLLGDGGLGLLNEDNQIMLADPTGSMPGFIIVDAAWADTETDGTSADADSGVLYLDINDGTDDQIVVKVLTSTSHTSCDGGTQTTAHVAWISIAGNEIAIPGAHTVLIDPALYDLIELHAEDAGDEGTDEGPDDTGAQAGDMSALMGNLTGAVADSETGCVSD